MFFWVGCWSAIVISALLLYKFCNFVAGIGSIPVKFLRLLIGILGGGLWFLLPLVDSAVENDIGRAAIYSAIGFVSLFWAFFLAPMLCYCCGLFPIIFEEDEFPNSTQNTEGKFELYDLHN